MGTTPFWKKIHQTVSAYSRNVTEEIVTEILNLSHKDLLQGLLIYKPYTKKGFTDFAEASDVGSMKEFVHELSQDLNLDSETAYAIMCNYLMFEYYGKIKEFWHITRIGTTNNLKESIWNFYTSERMFLLKTWRHILEFVDDEDYELADQYKEFITSFKMGTFQDNIVKMLEELMAELTTKNFNERNPLVKKLLCRNIREQTELVLILILTMKQNALTVNQISKVFQVFIQNNFSTTAPLYELRHFSEQKDITEFMYTEIGCFLVILENYWDVEKSDLWEIPEIKEVDKLLTSLHLSPGQTLVMLIWLFLKYKSSNNESDATKIVDLLNKEPFVLLHKLLTSHIFKKCKVGGIVLKSSHKMLDELCLLYDDRKALYAQDGLINSFAEVLKDADLAEICLQTRNGLDCLMEISLDSFPLDFPSFSYIAESLLGLENHYKRTIHLLNNMTTFLSEMTWSIPKEEVSVLKKKQRAISGCDLIIFPPNTVVKSYAIFGTNFLQYKGTYSYFLYLEYLVNLLLTNGIQTKKFDEILVQKVIIGYKVVIKAIINCRDMDLQLVGLENIINKANKILVQLDGQLLHFELVKLYFDVLNAMMIYRRSSFFSMCPQIVWKVFFPRLKADLIDGNVSKLLFNQYIFEDTVFMKLFKEEEFKDDHSLLITYINILNTIMNVKIQHKHFKISGVAYLLNFVFLQHQTWKYRDETQRNEIILGCLNIFHNVLQRRSLSETEQNIYNLCEYAFLHNVYVIESFLRLFIKEKYHLIFLMEREPNWVHGLALDKLKTIHMQLAILLLIMNLQISVGECTFKEKLPFIVKPVASFFTNAYSPVIAELSCRFLEKLSQDPYVPLLALLELDHYQVQSIFLERLRDPLEEDKVKMAIIDLINTCVSYQNGMTAAFFNLKCFMYWDGSEEDVFKGDSVSDFMVDYLQNIKKSHEYFKNPLQIGILRLLNNLWVHHRENLIESIANLKDFWPVMTAPFFCDTSFAQEVEVYTVILRIINLEIGKNVDKVDGGLIKTIEKFLNDKTRLKNWLKFVVCTSRENSQDNVEFLSAWIEFLCLSVKIKISFDDDSQSRLIDSCLIGLNTPESGFNSLEIICLWSEMYLLLISSWKLPEKEHKKTLDRILKFLNSLSVYYKYLTPSIKVIILSALDRTTIYLEKFFKNEPTYLLKYLSFIGVLIDLEYKSFDVLSVKDSERIAAFKPWLLLIFIGKTVLDVDTGPDTALWFKYRNFLQKVMNTIGLMTQHRATLPFAKLAFDFLVSYANSPLADDFLSADLATFYYDIKPPGLAVSVSTGVPIEVKEWWLIFIILLKLNRLLLLKLGNRMLAPCLQFVSQHDKTLSQLIALTTSTVDMTGLTLVCEALKLICVFLGLKPFWNVEASHSYQLIMDGVKTTINASVLSVLGYKKINFFKGSDGKKSEPIGVSTNLLVPVLNKLSEVIYWGATCLRKTKPDPIRPSPKQDIENVTLLVKIDFSVPRFELPISPNLTYGGLLCLADYLCKTLNQLSPQTPTVTPKVSEVSIVGLSDELRLRHLGQIFEHCTATYEECTGFMVYLQKSDDLVYEKLSTFLHYDLSEFSTSSAISQLDYHMVKNALEALMTFLACEIFYTLKCLNEEALFSYKREMSSEIQFFYEFVRKKTSEQYNAMIATPRSITNKSLINDTDIIKRYVMRKVNDGDANDIADNNFLLLISHWLIKFCNLSN